jgi:hypothetical protein
MSYANSNGFFSNVKGNYDPIQTDEGNTMPDVGDPLVSGNTYKLLEFGLDPEEIGTYFIGVQLQLDGDNLTDVDQVEITLTDNFVGGVLSQSNYIVNKTMPNNSVLLTIPFIYNNNNIGAAPIAVTISLVATFTGNDLFVPLFFSRIYKIC